MWKASQCAEKKNSIPVVAFGAGMLGKDSVKMKGYRVGLTNTLYEALQRKQKGGEAIVVYIDEYLTSKVNRLLHNIMRI
jgi:hypothetical protein